MKKPLIGILGAAIAFVAISCSNHTLKSSNPKTELDTFNYAIGMSIYNSINNVHKMELDPAMVAAGIKAAAAEDSSLFTEESVELYIREYLTANQKKVADAAKAEGRNWLENNKANEGVIELESGLQYKVIQEGEGKSPAETSTVTVHYEGKLTDGKVFDSSYERGQPATFGLNRVIRGWTEGLQLMKEGSIYELYIPSDLGYGERGQQSIPPNSVLIFKVELIEVKADE